MLEYIIIIVSVVLIFFMWLIYKKVDQKKDNQLEIKNEVLSEKLGEKIDKLIEKSTENQSNLSDKITLKQSESEKEIKSVVSNLNERLARIDRAQEEINEIKTSVIDFKNLFNNQTSRGKLGNDSLKAIVSDVLSKKYFKMEHTLRNGKRVDCFLFL